MEKKDTEKKLKDAQDKAAGDIQGAAGAYLARMRSEKGSVPSLPVSGEPVSAGLGGFVAGIFSNRPEQAASGA